MKETACRKSVAKSVQVDKYYILPRYDENSIKIAVATYGPVVVAYDASTWKFRYYKGNSQLLN
jgi:hypothetical protein